MFRLDDVDILLNPRITSEASVASRSQVIVQVGAIDRVFGVERADDALAIVGVEDGVFPAEALAGSHEHAAVAFFVRQHVAASCYVSVGAGRRSHFRRRLRRAALRWHDL